MTTLHNTQFLTALIINMKVYIALACVVAAASAYPMFLLEEEPEYVRVPRQVLEPDFAPVRPRIGNRRQGLDQDTAADTPYGHAVS